MGVNFGIVSCGDECVDFVGCLVESCWFVFSWVVEDIDEGLVEIFGIGFKSGFGYYGEKIGLDCFEGLVYCFLDWKIVCWYGSGFNWEIGKIEFGELIGEWCVYGMFFWLVWGWCICLWLC